MRNSGEERGSKERAIVTALAALHRDRERRRQSDGDGDGEEGVYPRALRYFERRSDHLSKERAITEELVAGLTREGATKPQWVQQELVIAGPSGGTAAGRFRVVNRSQRRARLELIAGEPSDGAPAPPIRMDPARSELGPGESTMVRVVADLAASRGREPWTVPIECRAGASRDRLWLVITPYSPSDDSR